MLFLGTTIPPSTNATTVADLFFHLIGIAGVAGDFIVPTNSPQISIARSECSKVSFVIVTIEGTDADEFANQLLQIGRENEGREGENRVWGRDEIVYESC